MSDNAYLKRLFQAYYRENKNLIPNVVSFENREFGFIPWEKSMMIRHMGFKTTEELANYLKDNGPRHVYSSGTLYDQPDIPDMNNKGYQGCDFIIDIDADHFFTPCKENHDFWLCKECGETGKGAPSKCPKCGKTKLDSLAWICEECLNIAKNEIKKLVYDFLIPDFGMNEKDMKFAFSGHRGYHLKIESSQVRALSTEDRREIVDYLTGENIFFESLGLKDRNKIVYGLHKDSIGWSQKILKKLEEILKSYDNNQLKQQLERFNLKTKQIESLLKYKGEFLSILLSDDKGIWNIEGFNLKTWEDLLRGVVREIGIRIDEPVAIDIHRLIRYPGSIHGKTGFKVQELSIQDLDRFNPLDAYDEKQDPIVFKSDKVQNLEVTAPNVPITKIKGESFGSYSKGDKIEVPLHIAVLLLCKEVARII